MTACLAAEAPACPVWCAFHACSWHCSEWRVWETDDSPRFALRLVRHDDDGQVGMVDVDVRVLPAPGNQVLDGDGVLECDDLRELARWMLAVAEAADPDRTNGEPGR